MTVLSARRLNRTLLARQHLLARAQAAPPDLIARLIGLQAQDPMPPYLSLAARLESFDPRSVTRGLEDRSLVRMLTLRGTVHLHVAADALALRPWVQPRLDAEERHAATVGSARTLDRAEFTAAVGEALTGGPLPLARLGESLTRRFPAHAPAELGQLARLRAPLLQVPPRGCWGRSGGVVYEDAARWTGGAMPAREQVDVEALVRRYLAAYGPAAAADLTAWSGVTRLGPVVTAMLRRGELVRHEDESGRPLVDVPDAELADADQPAPVRLLGVYDEVWLSHAARDRVTTPANRRAWTGPNGGLACTLFADGWLEGLWRVVDGRVEVIRTLRRLTRAEQGELDEEIARVEALLAVPALTAGAGGAG